MTIGPRAMRNFAELVIPWICVMGMLWLVDRRSKS